MALLFAILLGMSAIILGYFLYDFGKQNFLRETEAAIDNEIAHIRAVRQYNGSQSLADYINQISMNANHTIYLYQDKSGGVLAGNIDAVPEDVSLLKEGLIRFEMQADPLAYNVAAKLYTFENGNRVMVGRDIEPMTQTYERLQWFSGIIILFMLLVVIISFFISTFVVKRINIIANTAKHIMDTGDLSKRISINSQWDDLSNLAQILNSLLERIEELMQGIRDVSDSIAHDLRTPITRLRSELEELRNQRLTTKDIDMLVAEADRILNIFNALLRIANIEKGKRIQNFEQVNLAVLTQDVMELYEPLAESKNITLEHQIAPVPDIMGDPDLLFQMIANLLDNAIKFSHSGGTISLAMTQEGNSILLSVADCGEGIDESDMDKVFRRFYRADKSRHTSGSGLGLSMVKAVAGLHGVTVSLTNNKPGLRVTLVFSI